MVGLGIRFDLGRYHATPWAAHVNDARVEWPPSPWRILRGLYAVSRNHLDLAGEREAIDAAIRRLAGAPPPVYELPPVLPAHTRHYLPSRLWSPSRPGETDRVLDGFVALDRDSEVAVWWESDLSDRERQGLAAAAKALGYLGRSESVCSARLLEGAGPEAPDAAPLASGRVDGDYAVEGLVCVEQDGDPLLVLETSVSDLRQQRRVLPSSARLVEYAVSRERPSSAPRRTELSRPTFARYRLHGGSRPAIHEAVAVGEALRRAIQSRYGRQNERAASPVFSGRDGDAPRREQHRHAHYLVTPDREGRRVDHVVVWAPEGFGPKEVRTLASLERVQLHDSPEPLRIALITIAHECDVILPQVLGPSRCWRSLTPFALPRHPKRRATGLVDGPESQIARELALRGLPSPTSVELVRGGWARYRRTRAFKSRVGAPPVVGAQLGFDTEVPGPVAIGALSHFGLGLFIPDEQ